MTVQLTTRQQAARSGRGRRVTDAAAQQKALEAMGVHVSIEELQALPRGAWLRYWPQGTPLRVAQYVRA